ncbi:hypothetical protein ACFL0M_07120 [Thermodesulfobacteriota bacterium]
MKHYTIMAVDGQDLSDVVSCISSTSLNKDVVRTEEVVLTGGRERSYIHRGDIEPRKNLKV